MRKCILLFFLWVMLLIVASYVSRPSDKLTEIEFWAKNFKERPTK